jgi:Zn-dependent M28 family amino/carboxypeptidase
MRQLYLLVFILLALSCNNKTVVNPNKSSENSSTYTHTYNTTLLIEGIKELSLDSYEGRRTGTKGAITAKDYIIERFSALEAKPLYSGYSQDFEFSLAEKKYNASNVLAKIEGSEFPNKYIVISAHYDHEGIRNGQIYNGADDDASGVSALIAFADYFKKNPPKHSVILAAFDAEELGLKGAYHFVADNTIQQKKIVLNLNMDMISRSEKQLLFAVGTRYTESLKPVITKNNSFGKAKLVIGHEGLTNDDNWTNSSDHAAFYKASIPFIYFGVPDHKDYHKPTDDFENIDQAFYKDAVQIIINNFEDFDDLNY